MIVGMPFRPFTVTIEQKIWRTMASGKILELAVLDCISSIALPICREMQRIAVHLHICCVLMVRQFLAIPKRQSLKGFWRILENCGEEG
jgi:hypothetical protein